MKKQFLMFLMLAIAVLLASIHPSCRKECNECPQLTVTIAEINSTTMLVNNLHVPYQLQNTGNLCSYSNFMVEIWIRAEYRPDESHSWHPCCFRNDTGSVEEMMIEDVALDGGGVYDGVLDFNDVPAGQYRFEVIADPQDKIKECDE